MQSDRTQQAPGGCLRVVYNATVVTYRLAANVTLAEIAHTLDGLASRRHGNPVAIDFTLAAFKPSRPFPFKTPAGKAFALAPDAFARKAKISDPVRSHSAGSR
jgi:hypothetical protein